MFHKKIFIYKQTKYFPVIITNWICRLPLSVPVIECLGKQSLARKVLRFGGRLDLNSGLCLIIIFFGYLLQKQHVQIRDSNFKPTLNFKSNVCSNN